MWSHTLFYDSEWFEFSVWLALEFEDFVSQEFAGSFKLFHKHRKMCLDCYINKLLKKLYVCTNLIHKGRL